METDKISEQNQNNIDTEQQISEKHLKAVEEEQEQVKELLRRGSIRHYFLGPENIWTQEGFGTVVGGALTIFFGGFIFPKLFLYSSNSETLKIVCWIMTAIGIVVFGKGLYGMLKESRTESKPVPDEVHDEILEYDIAGLKKISKRILEEHIPLLTEKESLDSMETIFVKGPRDYVANVNLPLTWKLGDDGKLRYSNFSFMALYFGKEILYIYTCIYNMRNATAKFHHTYECPYDQIRFVGFEDCDIETVSQNNKSVTQNLKMLVIDTGDGENDKLSMPVADYGIMKKFDGIIDIGEAEEAVRVLNEKIRGVN
ncbi:MAG TPA: hypothetical protein VEA58_04870 [Anaerovoracaceae bacterium]|nr:hypothetical protein [Anaerovoracaceae bacterium]